jgi:hypothetical protein
VIEGIIATTIIVCLAGAGIALFLLFVLMAAFLMGGR